MLLKETFSDVTAVRIFISNDFPGKFNHPEISHDGQAGYSVNLTLYFQILLYKLSFILYIPRFISFYI